MAYRGETILDCNEEDEKNARRRGRATSSTFLEDDEVAARKRPRKMPLFGRRSIGRFTKQSLRAATVGRRAGIFRRDTHFRPVSETADEGVVRADEFDTLRAGHES